MLTMSTALALAIAACGAAVSAQGTGNAYACQFIGLGADATLYSRCLQNYDGQNISSDPNTVWSKVDLTNCVAREGDALVSQLK